MRCDSIPIRIETNRNETNRIFIAFISESIEKFTALEILSGTLQFTCRLPARRGNACAQTQAATGSRQRVELKRGTPPTWDCQQFILLPANFSRNVFTLFSLGNFWHAAQGGTVWNSLNRQLAAACFLSTFHIQLPLSFTLWTAPFCHPLLLLLSILLLFTLHWPLCCICFQFQLLRTVSPSDSASSLPFSCALPCSTIATWRIRNQPIPDLQLQFHFNTLGQINAMVNARYARIQEAKLLFTKDISQVKGSIVLFSWIIFIL